MFTNNLKAVLNNLHGDFCSDGNSRRLMNTTTVDLDEPSDEDLVTIRNLINEFIAETGSTYAKQILDNWQTMHTKIIKIFPKDFKAALKALEAEKKQEVIDAVKENEAQTQKQSLQVCFVESGKKTL